VFTGPDGARATTTVAALPVGSAPVTTGTAATVGVTTTGVTVAHMAFPTDHDPQNLPAIGGHGGDHPATGTVARPGTAHVDADALDPSGHLELLEPASELEDFGRH